MGVGKSNYSAHPHSAAEFSAVEVLVSSGQRPRSKRPAISTYLSTVVYCSTSDISLPATVSLYSSINNLSVWILSVSHPSVPAENVQQEEHRSALYGKFTSLCYIVATLVWLCQYCTCGFLCVACVRLCLVTYLVVSCDMFGCVFWCARLCLVMC